MTYDMEFVRRVLEVFDKYDQHDDLWWRTGKEYGGGQYNQPAQFLAKCSDVFWWGTADCEDITPENIGELEQAMADAKAACKHGEIYGAMLFCARVRKLRPQGACYPKEPELWPLFDACGPHRETGMGNPHPHPRDKKPKEVTV